MTARDAPPRWDVVVPTVGRASLRPLVAALSAGAAHGLGGVVVVDDRRDARVPLPLPGGERGVPVRVVPGGGRGPAAARNCGWRATRAPWVVFVDDDVALSAGWFAALVDDLAAVDPDVAGVQGRVVVPAAPGRRATDQERSVGNLAGARWATAEMAYRRDALDAAGGFDERFPRAYREDADLALRLRRAGWRLHVGERRCVHPPRAAPWTASLHRQRGNADDALMRRLHGRGWRAAAAAPRGRLPLHAATTLAGLVAVGARVAGRRRLAAVAAAAWVGATAQFAAARIAPGPRTGHELATMVVSSVAIPPLAVGWRVRGALRRPFRRVDPLPTAGPPRGGKR